MDTGGLKTAVAELLGEAAGDEAPEQLALLPLADAARVADAGGVLPAVAERRGPGRRPGTPNRSTLAMREYLARRYVSPLVGLAETWTRPVEALAAELGVSKVDAYRLQQAAMEAALPYWHSKAPTEVAVSGAGLMPLVIQIGDRAGGGDGFEALRNQWVSGEAAVGSERSHSERPGEVVEATGETDA